MEGISLSNMLGAEEVEKLFGTQAPQDVNKIPEEKNGEESPEEIKKNEETAEVDFSDLIGNQSEGVGSEEITETGGGTPKSQEALGTPQPNLFSSIAKALRDEGVFPDLSDDTLTNTRDAASLRQLFDDEVAKALDERQRRIEKALDSGTTTEELQEYQQAMSVMQFLEKKETYDSLSEESEEGEKLRKQVMYQDYVNKGMKPERAMKLIQKSIDDGSDIEDAKEAFEACKEFYKEKVEDYQQEMEERRRQSKEAEEKQYANLKKHILETEEFYGGVKVDKTVRQKAYEALTKPVYRDDQGNVMTALQKYQKENPIEFMENVAMLYALTDNFKSVEKLAKGKVKSELKKGFAELESVLNSSRRNSDGTLNLANSAPDDAERDKWTLAV